MQTNREMNHFCSASSEADRITKWDAEERWSGRHMLLCIYANGYMEEMTDCIALYGRAGRCNCDRMPLDHAPACGSTVSVAIDEEIDEEIDWDD